MKLIILFFLSVNIYAKPNIEVIEKSFSKLSLNFLNEPEYKLDPNSKKTTIINFWASWCLPCLKEFKSLKKLRLKHADKFNIVAINVDEDDQKALALKTIKKQKLNFPVHLDVDHKILNSWEIDQIPTSIFITNQKVVKYYEKEIDFNSKEVLKILNINN